MRGLERPVYALPSASCVALQHSTTNDGDFVHVITFYTLTRVSCVELTGGYIDIENCGIGKGRDSPLYSRSRVPSNVLIVRNCGPQTK